MLNTNANERKRSAAKDLALKLSLEAALYRKILPIFNEYNDSFRKTLEATNTIYPIDNLQSQFQSILNNHYVKVADKFSDRIVQKLGKPDNHDQILAAIKNRTNTHHANRVQQQSAIIADTTIKDASQSLIETQQQLSQQQRILGSKEIAALAALTLRQKTQRRLSTISNTETQNPAEHAKQKEFEVLTAAQYGGIHEREKEKMWQAIIDAVTRDAHAEADGQTVPHDDPYIVMGQKLMYPGDISMGATIDNVINCRCSSVPIIR